MTHRAIKALLRGQRYEPPPLSADEIAAAERTGRGAISGPPPQLPRLGKAARSDQVDLWVPVRHALLQPRAPRR
jgi:hypothetical protein